jgi:hypothetical protein
MSASVSTRRQYRHLHQKLGPRARSTDDRVMRWRILTILLLAGGCGGVDPIAQTEAVCDVLCDCLYTLPTANELCTADCIEDIGGGIPPDCADCIQDNACLWEVQCENECFISKPLLERP